VGKSKHLHLLFWKRAERPQMTLEVYSRSYYFVWYYKIYPVFSASATFCALTLLVGWPEGRLACENFAPKTLSHGSWSLILVGGVQAVVPYGNPNCLSAQLVGQLA